MATSAVNYSMAGEVRRRWGQAPGSGGCNRGVRGCSHGLQSIPRARNEGQQGCGRQGGAGGHHKLVLLQVLGTGPHLGLLTIPHTYFTHHHATDNTVI